MEQQIVIEFMGLLGSQSIDFSGDPLRVKMSPHSHPTKITHLKLDNRNVIVECNGEEVKFNNLSMEAKATIGQRLRLMLSETQYPETKHFHAAPPADAVPGIQS